LYTSHYLADKYLFYFPEIGSFPHIPVFISKSGELLAYSISTTVVVTSNPKPIDKKSWTTISSRGSTQDILDYLEAENLNDSQLSIIVWRARDRGFCIKVTDLLRKKKLFNAPLWSYGFSHGLPTLMREYLEHIPEIASQIYWLRSPLLDINGKLEYLDYYPLVNARGE